MAARWIVSFVLAVAVVGAPGWAAAHPIGVSQGEYVVRDGKVYAGVTFARRELGAALPWLRGNGETESPLLFEKHREELGRWLTERLIVTASGGACPGAFDGMRFDGDGAAFALAYACPDAIERIDVDARFLTELDRGHRHLAALSIGDERFERIATKNDTHMLFDLGLPSDRADPVRGKSSAPGVAPMIRMGIEHILTGYDHLLFLFGLVLVGGPLRSLVGAITAFTVAHSITLGLAAFDVWTPSPRVVEPCIALSIAYVGIENWFVPDARGRWRITFPFGLVHGFGFASALREIALRRDDVPTALFGFNLGVEVGQLAVLAAMVPLVGILRKMRGWERFGMRLATAVVALSGVIWFVARVWSA